jgi:hypothetical protein
MPKIKVIKKAGEKPIKFKEGALRSQMGVAKGEKIPESKMEAAEKGKMGKLAQKRAMFAKNVLVGKK